VGAAATTGKAPVERGHPPPAAVRRTRVLRLLQVSCAAVVLAACATSHADPPAHTPRPGRYLALGDSFTIGTGTTPDRSFPARLAALWSAAAACQLRNAGVNGFTTQDLLDVELPQVRPFAPTFVTLAVGANDIVHGSTPEAYRTQVKRILAQIAAAGPAHVVAIPQPDWALSPAAAGFGQPAEIEARIVAFNAILRDETTKAGGQFFDLFPLMQTQARAGMIAGDGLHPSAAAYDAWAVELAHGLGSLCGG